MKFFFILICLAIGLQCKHDKYNSTCDSQSKAFLETLTILLSTSERFQLCNVSVFSPRIKIPRFLIVTNVGTNAATSSISVFRINPTTGEIAQVDGSPYQLTNRPRHSVTNSSGTIVYVANIGSTSISVLALNSETGALSVKFSDVSVPTTPYSLTMDPSGKYLFASSESSQQIHRYSIDGTGNILNLTPATATSNPTLGSVGRMVFDTKGKHLYAGLTSGAANISGIQGFNLDPLSGALTSIGVYQTGENNLSVAISPNDKFVYGANYFSQDVFAAVRNIENGVLTVQPAFSAGIAPGFSLVDPLNRFLYVANSGTGQGNISAYSVSPINGTLTSISGSPFNSGFSPIGLSIDKSGKFLYSSNTEGGNVSGFTISENGSLVPINGFPVTAGTNPFSVEIVSY
ncbi:lactonase family protein [Leptospira sp. WS39.C2]